MGQSAPEFTDLGHGIFTSALIPSFYRGDENNDGVVSLTEPVEHVQDLVPRLVKDPKARTEILRRGPIGKHNPRATADMAMTSRSCSVSIRDATRVACCCSRET